jgi:hypothetical protein
MLMEMLQTIHVSMFSKLKVVCKSKDFFFNVMGLVGGFGDLNLFCRVILSEVNNQCVTAIYLCIDKGSSTVFVHFVYLFRLKCICPPAFFFLPLNIGRK